MTPKPLHLQSLKSPNHDSPYFLSIKKKNGKEEEEEEEKQDGTVTCEIEEYEFFNI